MVCITLGTGIGGGLVIGGRLFRGAYGMAGEWGHMISVPDGHWCECGNRGCWEQYASGNALVRDARALARTNSPTAYRLLEIVGGDPDKISGPIVTAAAIQGEPTSVELLADVGNWLGRGIADIAAALDPEVVVIGGGVSAAGDLLVVPAQRAFSRTLTGRGFREEARLVLASFRNDAGLIGAADLARHAMIEPPESAQFGFWPRRRKRRMRKARARRESLRTRAPLLEQLLLDQLEDRSIACPRRPLAGESGHQDAESAHEAPDRDPACPSWEADSERRCKNDEDRVADPDPAE